MCDVVVEEARQETEGMKGKVRTVASLRMPIPIGGLQGLSSALAAVYGPGLMVREDPKG